MTIRITRFSKGCSEELSRDENTAGVETCGSFLEGVPASFLTGVENEKVVGLTTLYRYTRLDRKRHEQFVNPAPIICPL